MATVARDDFRREHPDGVVLSRETGDDRDYGRNPYVGYENLERPLTGFVTGETDPRARPSERCP